MTEIRTSLTTLLGIKTPILCAPMAGASGGALAAQTTLGGGFGFVSGYDSPEKLQLELNTARSLLQAAEYEPLRIGVGFLVWQLEKDPSMAEKFLLTAISQHVHAIWLAFGEDLGRWIRFIRTCDQNTGNEKAVKIFVQISTVGQAVQAVKEWKTDVIVVQGNEAGGHGIANSLPLLTLFPLLLETITAVSGGRPPPLVGAGGLATGAQIAALFSLGASGAVLGTRFLLCPESLYTDSQRQALIEAQSSDSVRTMAFDYARNTLSWPRDVDGRGLRNDTVLDFENGVDVDTIRKRFADGVQAGETSRMVIWAGSGVGLMKNIVPAQDIVKQLHEECLLYFRQLINNSHQLVVLNNVYVIDIILLYDEGSVSNRKW